MSEDTMGKDVATTAGDGAGAGVDNPYSLPAVGHQPPLRQTDISDRARRRAARQVATMFGLSAIMVVLFFVAFWAIDPSTTMDVPWLGTLGALHVSLGLTFGLAIFLIGTGAVHWSKKLMSGVEVVQERHPFKSSEEDTEGAAEVYQEGVKASTWKEFPIIRRTMLLAMALVPIPFLISLRDLWISPSSEAPSAELYHTLWEDGMKIVTDITYEPIRADEIPVGGLVNAAPENLVAVEHEEHNLNARAKASIILVRMRPDEIVSQQDESFGYNGLLAFSKICTHVGCPISLYQQRTHELLCPCHQSTFDLSDSANVVFGPAARRMPQLPIGVDDDGFLIAKGDFAEPVGPSFWELEGN